MESEDIVDAIRKYGNVSAAAVALQIPRTTFINRALHACLEVLNIGQDDGAFDDTRLSKALKSGLRIPKASVSDELANQLLNMKGEGRSIAVHVEGDEIVAHLDKDFSHRAVTDPESATITSDNGVFRIGLATDMHLGSRYERLDELHDFYNICESEGVNVVVNCGNWIDGNIRRINGADLHTHGIGPQIDYLVENYPKRSGVVTMAVWGDDHEGWDARDAGVDVGIMAERAMRSSGREDWFNLGFMERDIALVNGKSGKRAKLRAVHPGGGSSYAVSYTMQKLIESYDGGDKPAVLFAGHYHKMDAGEYRNTWYFQGGCFQDQTPFMRKKRISAHVGGLIVTLHQDQDTGAIVRASGDFIRYFERPYYGKHSVNRFGSGGTEHFLPSRRGPRDCVEAGSDQGG